MRELETAVYIINKAIESAIKHGGDAGGPYYSNKEEHKETMESLAFLFGDLVSVVCVDDNWYKLEPNVKIEYKFAMKEE